MRRSSSPYHRNSPRPPSRPIVIIVQSICPLKVLKLVDSFLIGRCPSATVLVNTQLLDSKNVISVDHFGMDQIRFWIRLLRRTID